MAVKDLYNMVAYQLIGYQMSLRANDEPNTGHSLGSTIVLLSRNLQHAFDLELCDKFGITMAQWRATNILAAQNGITQREIADKLGLDTSTIIPLIDRLESKEFVKRMPDHSDRRINRIYLTSKAASLLGEMHMCANLFKKSLTYGISKDRLEITRLVLER